MKDDTPTVSSLTSWLKRKLDDNSVQWEEALTATANVYENKQNDLVLVIKKQLSDLVTSPVPVGTRVYVKPYRCDGAVTDVELVPVWENDDYYADDRRPDELSGFKFQFTVQPDNSPGLNISRKSYKTFDLETADDKPILNPRIPV